MSTINHQLLVNTIVAIAKKNPEGFTFDVKSGKYITSGYVFSYAETQNSFGLAGIERVAKFILKNNQSVVGGWFNEDDGQFYFDASVVVPTLQEAIEFGLANNQLAVYDLNAGCENNLKNISINQVA